MVNTAQATHYARRAWQALCSDLRGTVDSLRPAAQPRPGLYTYRIELPGGRRRLHLRIEPGGGGLLFIDAMDVIYLNASAALLAGLALEGVPQARAAALLRRKFRNLSRSRSRDEAAQMYRLVRHLATSIDACPTCAVDQLGRRALFSTRAAAPYKADLALTYGCNNSCSHCYNEADRLAMPSLPRDGWLRVLDRLHAAGVPHIIFTGGEATLHPDLPDLVAHADRLGQITGLNTNGRRIAHQPYMRELADAGLSHIQVTLASHLPHVHDAVNGASAFHQTVRGIENALASGVHAITNTTLMRANMDATDELVDFLHRLGLRTFAMNGMIYSGGGFRDENAIAEDELAPLLIRVRDKAAERGMRFLWYTPTEYCRMSPVELEIGAKRCNAGEYSLCVEPNGDVLPCQSYYAAAGNLLRDPWETIWRSDLFRSFREREDDPRAAGLPEKCWHCPDLPLCGGGCRIEREAREGRRTADNADSSSGTCGSGGCGSGGCGSTGGATAAAAPAGFVPSGMLVDTARRARGAGRGTPSP